MYAFRAEMEPPEWEGCGFELARALVGAASRVLANAQMSSEEKARATILVLGFHWAEKTVRAVGAANIAVVARRAMRHPGTKDLARKRRARLRRIWFALPQLSAEEPRKWWNLIATAGLGGRAAEE